MVHAAQTDTAPLGSEHHRVAVIGTGFGGLGAAVRLRRAGVTDVVLLERADAVGGTWRDNTYPGCACDVPSHLYSFSFAPNPDWPRTFSGQADIRAYLERVTDTFGLRPHIRFDCEVLSARWDPGRHRWELHTRQGTLTADVVVSAAGPLSEPRIPDIPGVDTFPGPVFHSARWDHDVDLRDRRVAVVGTGASAIQIVPAIQARTAHLTLFQRTPAWVLPRMDRTIGPLERRLYRLLPATRVARRTLLWAIRELQTGAFTRHPNQLAFVEKLAKRHLYRAVKDPELRRVLTPDYRIGCKRILLSNDYYPALAQPHVDVVPAGLAEVRGSTLVATDGTETEADVLIFGTGFHVTDMPIAQRITGADGRTLAEHWRDGMAALRGTTIAGFPNLLLIIGPNTGLANTSMILMMEAQLNYLVDYLRQLDRLGDHAGTRVALSPRRSAVQRWNDRLQQRMRRTVWNTGGCTSWYLDANGRNTTLWPATTSAFRRATRRVDLTEYEVLRADTARHTGPDTRAGHTRPAATTPAASASTAASSAASTANPEGGDQ